MSYFEVITDERKLNPGDQIAVVHWSKTMLPYPYMHHGIYISRSEGVIDFGEARHKSRPTNRRYQHFSKSGERTVYRLVYTPGSCLPAEEVVKRAKSYLTGEDDLGGYSMLVNNCEHFATWCKTGEKSSEQVSIMLGLADKVISSFASYMYTPTD